MADHKMKEMETESAEHYLVQQARTSFGYTQRQAETLVGMAADYSRLGGLEKNQWDALRAQRININDVITLGRTLQNSGITSKDQLKNDIRGYAPGTERQAGVIRDSVEIAWHSAQPEMSGPVPKNEPVQAIPSEAFTQAGKEAQKRKSTVSEADRTAFARMEREHAEAMATPKKKGGPTVIEGEGIKGYRGQPAPEMRYVAEKPKEIGKPREPLALTVHAREKPKPEEEKERLRFNVPETALASRGSEPSTAGKPTEVRGPRGSFKPEEAKERVEAMLKYNIKPSELQHGEIREYVYEILVRAKDDHGKEYVGTLRIPHTQLTEILQKCERRDNVLPGKYTKKEDDRVDSISFALNDAKVFAPDMLRAQVSGTGGKTLAQLLDMDVSFSYVARK